MGKRKKSRGFSITELLVALIVGFIVLTGIVLAWNTVEKAWLIERIHSVLLGELETFAERFKKEISASDANQIFFYPETSLTYEAISFPAAVDDDNDGFIELDTDGIIIWDETIIYHVFVTPEGETQLRRTVFAPRIDLSKEDRQIQINQVVSNGQAIETTPNFQNAETRFLFTCTASYPAEPVELIIEPSAREFDAYSLETARSKEISFGNTTLTAGEHYITFQLAGTSHGGYELGLDSFAFSPSGCHREAEECLVHSDSGKTKINEDMVSCGSWNANRHLEYQSNQEDDFISLNFYYDEWIETNFHRCSPAKTLIDYSNTDGDGGTASNKDYIVRLSGYGETWNVQEQVGAGVSEEALDIESPVVGRNYRNVISYQITDTDGSAVRFKFKNCSAIYDLHLESATLFERSDGPDGDEGTKKIITFSGNPSVTITKGNSLWSDWINMLDINDFKKDEDYLLSIFVSKANPIGLSIWPGSAGAAHAYYIESDTNFSEEADWSAAGESNAIYALEAIEVSYYASGTLTSQIYDTDLDNPSFSTLSWNIAKNNYGNYAGGGLGADLILKVRSDDDKNAILSDNDWSDELAIDTQSTTSGSADISGVSGGRYVQFQAEFYSQPSSGSYDYIKSCVLKNVSIKWPGESTPGGTNLVDISGYITTRPDYGRFSVEVDGKPLTKGLELSLTLTKNIFGVGPVSRSVSAVIQPRNTAR